MSLRSYNGEILHDICDGAFVSVTEYGAIGDGSHDDAEAIQACLDAKRSGGIIYFPIGIYKITQGLLFYSNQSLIFENGATILQGAEIDNLLMSYCDSDVTEYNGAHDCLVYGAVFDGGAYTTNNTLVGIVHSKNITFEKCIFRNAYGSWHDMEINSSLYTKVIDCDFEGSRKTSTSGCLIQVDTLNNATTWPWDNNRGVIDNTHSKFTEIYGCVFHDASLPPAIGNHSDENAEHVLIHNNIFNNIASTRGVIQFQNSVNVSIVDNSFKDCSIGVGNGGTLDRNYFINNNIFTNVAKPTSVSDIQGDSIINGVVSHGITYTQAYIQRLIEQMTEFVINGVFETGIDDFENGSYSYSQKSSSTRRLRSKILYPVKSGYKVRFTNPSFKVYFGTLDSKTGSTYIVSSGWLPNNQIDAEYTFSRDGYANIILEKADGTTTDISEYDCTISISMNSN